MPTYQNPTTSVMGDARRAAVIAVARRHGLPIIEDDIYSLLQDVQPKPLASLAPDLVYFIDSTSKTMAPGLRIGFVLAARDRQEPLQRALNASTWMASPLSAEIAARWMRDGTAERLTLRQRQEAAARWRIMHDSFGADLRPQSGQGCHVWLKLPDRWQAPAFVAESGRRGVRVLAAETFAIGRQPLPNAVRIGIGAAHSREELARAARVLSGILREPPALAEAIAAPAVI